MIKPMWMRMGVVCAVVMVSVAVADPHERMRIEERLHEIHREARSHQMRDMELPAELREEAERLEGMLRRMERAEHEPEVQRALGFLERLHKPHADALRALRAEDEDEFYEQIEELAPWLEEMHEMREHEPEMFEIELRAHRLEFDAEALADQARKASGPEHERLSGELHGKLRELFAVRLEIRTRQLGELEEEITELRNQVSRMEQRSEELIKQRLNAMLLGDEDW